MNFLADVLQSRILRSAAMARYQALVRLVPAEPLPFSNHRLGMRALEDLALDMDGVLDRATFDIVSLRRAALAAVEYGISGPVVPELHSQELLRMLLNIERRTVIDEDTAPRSFVEVRQTVFGTYVLLPQNTEVEPTIEAFVFVAVEAETSEQASEPNSEFELRRWDLRSNQLVDAPSRCQLVLTSPDPDGVLACRSRGCSGTCEPVLESVEGTQEVRVIECNCC